MEQRPFRCPVGYVTGYELEDIPAASADLRRFGGTTAEVVSAAVPRCRAANASYSGAPACLVAVGSNAYLSFFVDHSEAVICLGQFDVGLAVCRKAIASSILSYLYVLIRQSKYRYRFRKENYIHTRRTGAASLPPR